MHLFEGTIENQHFVIRRLAQQGSGWSWTWGFNGATQAEPGLEGWVSALTSGSQLQLRYRAPLTTWGLLLVPAGAFLKLANEDKPLLLALVEAAAAGFLAWLLAWGAFRREVAQWRSELAELLQLRRSATA